MRAEFIKTVGMSAPALVLAGVTAAQAATFNPFEGGSFDFGARNLGPRESTVALQAISEMRDDGEVRACVMSGFKQGIATAIPGYAYDALLNSGSTPLEAVEQLDSSALNRSSYRVDAAYIIMADYSGDEQDFVRINVGAPQQEEARLFIDGAEVDPSALLYEYSERYGHPEREAESYTIKIEDPAVIAQVRDALANQQEIQLIPRSVLNDYVLPYTFVGNVSLAEEFADCQENLDDMNISRGTFPDWGLSGMLTNDRDDVLALAAMLEDEAALMNPDNYQIANVLWTEGMFAIGPHVLQKMLNGEVVTSSMGEYISENHLTGVITVSPDVLEFTDNFWNSCSCTVDFFPPGTPNYGGGIPSVGTPSTNYGDILRSGGGGDGFFLIGGGDGDTITTITETPSQVGIWDEYGGSIIGSLTALAPLVGLGIYRRMKSSSEVAQDNAAAFALEA